MTGEGMRGARRAAQWLRWPYSAFVAVLVPVYWHHYGPENFLWLSDIALFAILISLWTGSRLPYSMMAVGVLPVETVWLADFLALGNTTGAAAYMFDADLPLYLRGLSLFNFVLAPILIWMLWRWGYDRRALVAQTALIWILFPLTWLVTSPADDINWVFGPGEAQHLVPPLLYLGLCLVLLPVVVHYPMHLLLGRLFGGGRGLGRSRDLDQ